MPSRPVRPDNVLLYVFLINYWFDFSLTARADWICHKKSPRPHAFGVFQRNKTRDNIPPPAWRNRFDFASLGFMAGYFKSFKTSMKFLFNRRTLQRYSPIFISDFAAEILMAL